MSTYAYINLSGSTGKTASVIATACILAEDGVEVEVLDFDLQAGASTVLGYPYYEGKTVADVLRGTATIGEIARPARIHLGDDPSTGEPVFETIPGISVIPTARSALKPFITEMGTARGAHLLRKSLVIDGDQRREKPPQVRLIDCGGVESPLLQGAALATTWDEDERPGAQGVITCAKPAGKELEGVPDLIEELQKMTADFNRSVGLLSVIPCIIPSQGGPMGQAEQAARQYQFRVNSGYRPMLESMEEAYDSVLIGGVTPPVRRTNEVDHAYTARTPLAYFRPALTKPIMDDYRLVVAYQRKRGLFVPPRVEAA